MRRQAQSSSTVHGLACKLSGAQILEPCLSGVAVFEMSLLHGWCRSLVLDAGFAEQGLELRSETSSIYCQIGRNVLNCGTHLPFQCSSLQRAKF